MTINLETPASEVEGDDLYPEDEEGQKKIVDEVQKYFTQARDAKQGHTERWEKYYKMYRSYVKKRAKGDWRSRVWMPIAFYVIETITPRLVAQLPNFIVKPVGPEDVPGAEFMEDLLGWAADQSDLYLELVKALKSSLLYGTGILKTSYIETKRFQISRQPVMVDAPPMPGQPLPEADVDGQPMMGPPQPGGQVPSPDGAVETVKNEYISYAGPMAEAVDIVNFFIDPVADSIESARYVIHRVYRDKAHLEDYFNKGVYKRPPEEIWKSFLQEHSSLARQALIGLGPGGGLDQDTNLIPLLELWTDGMIVTVAGDEHSAGVLLRAEKNPYMHGEKPFVRIVDHLVPHEFWGIGELEPLEGLQDTLNAIWNSRIDNVKLNLNSMFLAVMDYMVDPSDLQMGPSKVIRVREGVPLDQAVKRLDLGDVTSSSYTEAQEVERMTEKASGVSPYTSGSEGTQSYNRTATGVALISEQGNTRFSHKVKIAELTGFRRLGRQYGMLLQQFSPPEMVVRMQGPIGGFYFQQLPYDAITGRFDYDIEAESSTQTESIRREQTLSLFQMLAADPYIKPLKIREDVIKELGRKNVQDYLLTPEELAMAMGQSVPAEGGGGQAEMGGQEQAALPAGEANQGAVA